MDSSYKINGDVEKLDIQYINRQCVCERHWSVNVQWVEFFV